jgi:hypothetical protein
MDVEGLARLLARQGVLLATGLSDEEVAGIEATFAFRFPPDLKALLQHVLPISPGFPNWRDEQEPALRKRLAWPVEGLDFDLEHNDFWLEAWGPKPWDLATAMGIAHREIEKAPKLIPIYSHRFIPDEPCLAGNPVFSLWQFTDTIYYGTDLVNYLEYEFSRGDQHPRPGLNLPDYGKIRRIRFWSQLVE